MGPSSRGGDCTDFLPLSRLPAETNSGLIIGASRSPDPDRIRAPIWSIVGA